MGPVQSIKTCLSKSFVFSGRSSRSEFWSFAAFVVALSLIAAWLDWTLFTAKAYSGSDRVLVMLRSSHNIALISGILVLIPLLAASRRRLTDLNASHLWCVLPFIGAFGLLGWVWSNPTSAGGIIDLRQSQEGTIEATCVGYVAGFFAPILPILFPFWLYIKPSTTPPELTSDSSNEAHS